MAYENGEWIMHGRAEDDPERVKSVEELIAYVETVGFLPLFKNEIAGFSVEEQVGRTCWWTGDTERDPWEWRAVIARSQRLAYGKFFGKKAGFISLTWLPYFVNLRRDGYDFDSLFEEGIARQREKRLMDLFTQQSELFSFEMKEQAGFGKGGEKNFSGILTDLQMQTYLVVKDFRQRVSKKGKPYGMSVAVYTPPEMLWGYETVTAAYGESPEASGKRIRARVQELYPAAEEKTVRKCCLDGGIQGR